jgi:predicted NUDIX family NTP pyrophosphohydrolase
MVKNFNDYLNESWKDIESGSRKDAAGVAIKYNNKVLLVHPTGASWKKSALGIPKGGIEKGEDPIDAAVRELREETGISIDKSRLDPDPEVIHVYKGNSLDWQLIYFNMNINDLSEIGMKDLKVSNKNLQLEEIDWAGFVEIDEAYGLIHRNQLILLDRIR